MSWGGIDSTQVTSLWLQNLPLRADESEAKIAHAQLCDAIESGDMKIMGENNYQNLTHLLRIMSEIFIDLSETFPTQKNVNLLISIPTQLSSNNNNNTNNNELSTSLAHSSTIYRMQTIVRQVVGSVGSNSGLNQDILNKAMQTLSTVQQQIIQSVL